MSVKSSNKKTHYLGKIAARAAHIEEAQYRRWSKLLLLPVWVLIAFVTSNVLISGLLWVFAMVHMPLEDFFRPAIFQTVTATMVYTLTIALAIGIPYLLRRQKTTLAVLGLDRLPTWVDIGLAPLFFIGYTLSTAAVLAMATSWIPGFPIDEVQDVGFKAFGTQSDNILAFMTLVVLAPLAEEVLFRGYLYGKLKGYVPAVAAAIATSLLFGIAHLQWNVGLDVFILSLALCGLRSLTGSIWSGVLVHMIKNGIAYYFLFINPLLGG
jgi:membrane protease YdiL (CAAX protease family)